MVGDRRPDLAAGAPTTRSPPSSPSTTRWSTRSRPSCPRRRGGSPSSTCAAETDRLLAPPPRACRRWRQLTGGALPAPRRTSGRAPAAGRVSEQVEQVLDSVGRIGRRPPRLAARGRPAGRTAAAARRPGRAAARWRPGAEPSTPPRRGRRRGARAGRAGRRAAVHRVVVGQRAAPAPSSSRSTSTPTRPSSTTTPPPSGTGRPSAPAGRRWPAPTSTTSAPTSTPSRSRSPIACAGPVRRRRRARTSWPAQVERLVAARPGRAVAGVAVLVSGSGRVIASNTALVLPGTAVRPPRLRQPRPGGGARQRTQARVRRRQAS